MNWLVSSLVALLGWGVWGVFSKLASRYFGLYQIYATSSIVTLIAFPAVLFFLRPQLDFGSPGFGYSLLAGVAGTSALIGFYSAIGAGETSIVVPLTALYPVVTIILSYLILSEQISPVKGLGLVLALVAILLLSLG